jgi:hypothetical protein
MAEDAVVEQAGARREATSAAEPTMKPSISSTIFASAAASMAPTMVAISKPPNSAST